MRDITFRARRKDNGDWVYGVPLKEGYSQEVEMLWYEYSSLAYTERVQVIPETVGLYTGLLDKDGKKIFEGDILKIARVSDSIGSYYFQPLVYPVNVVVRWDMCAWTWETLCKDKRYIHFPDAWCHYECEVIGNIHDNPELLEVK